MRLLLLISILIFNSLAGAATYEVSVQVKTNDGVDLKFPKTKVRTGESISANKSHKGRRIFLELSAAETSEGTADQSLPPNVPLKLTFALGEYGPKGETRWINNPQMVLQENEESQLTTGGGNGAPEVTVKARARRLDR